MFNFPKFKIEVIHSINSKNSNSDAFSKLHEFQKEIYKTGALSDPFISDTKDFLNDFSVKIINFILNTVIDIKNEQKLADLLGKTLKRYTKIFLKLFNDPVNYFFETSTRMFDIQCSFYSTTETMNFFGAYQESPYYLVNINLLKSSKIIDKISTNFANSQKPLFDNFYLYLHLLKIIEKHFSQSTIKQCFEICNSKVTAFCDTLEGNDLRDVNEKSVNQSLALIYSLGQLPNTESISTTIIKVNIKFAKSSFLKKRFAGLSTLRSFLTKNPTLKNWACSILFQERVLEAILKDFHHELVDDFVAILKEMIFQHNNEVDILKKFWDISLNQHSSTIDTFFRGWMDLTRSLSDSYKDVLFELICNTQHFPDSCLEFIKSIVYLANNDQRIKVFTSLEQFYLNNSDQQSEDLLIQTICSYLPYNDSFRQTVLEKTLKMIENGDHFQLALNLMMASSSRINSEQANKLIDLTISHLTKDHTLQFLGLIQRIAYQLTDTLLPSQSERIIELTIDYFKSDDLNVVNSVCSFYSKLLYMYNKVLTFDMVKHLYNILCNLDCINITIFELIKQLFNYYDKGTENTRTTKHDADALDQLWHLLFRTQINEIYKFLTKIESTQSYIDKCMEHYTNIGALKALFYFIHAIEDGINKDLLNIHPNIYIDQEDMVTVNITGEIIQSLRLPKNLNYDSLFHRIAQLMNKKCDLLTFEEDGRVVYEKDQKIKDGMTINVRYSGIYAKSLTDKIDFSKLPTNILMKTEYQEKLYGLLNDETLGPFALKILNEMPTIESETIIFKAKSNQTLQNDSIPKETMNESDQNHHDITNNETISMNQTDTETNQINSLNETNQIEIDNQKKDIEINHTLNAEPTQTENKENQTEKMNDTINLDDNQTEKIEQNGFISNEIVEYEFNWNNYLTTDNLFLLDYRLNIIANNISQNNKEWMDQFFNTGGAFKILSLGLSDELYNDLVEIHLNDIEKQQLKSNIRLYLLLLRIVRRILEFNSEKTIKNFASEKVSQFNKLIVKVGSHNLGFIILSNLLYILKSLTDCLSITPSEYETFTSLLELTLFSSYDIIRKTIFEIMQKVPPVTYQFILLPLLTKAVKMNSVDCFTLLYPVAQETDDPLTIWTKLLEIIFTDFVPSKSLPVLDQLRFSIPSSKLSSVLFQIMNVLVDRISDPPKLSELFCFLVNEILLNTTKYFEISKEFVDLLINLQSKNSQLANFVIPNLKEVRNRMKEMKTEGSYQSIQSATAKYRGLRNLGATCYMDSLLQQLFAIPIFRNAVLSSDIPENDDDKWFLELQYLFLKLLLFPSTDIDPSSFVKCWKGWDDKPINPREQQDAIEFLQMFLDRIEEKVPLTKSLFKGTILHHTDGIGCDFHQDLNEEYVNLPIEVKNHKNISESFETYCSPDRFDGPNRYRTDEFGLIDAIQTHRILKPPPQLIITLKRFEYNLSTMIREKVNSHYIFPTDLDISSIMVDKTIPVNYGLYGVVIHMGSALGGHYISHIKEDDGKWYIFNDSLVTPESLNSMLSSSYGGLSNTQIWDQQTQSYVSTPFDKGSAYLLFYRKCDFDFHSQIEKVHPQLLDRLLKDIQCEILKKLEGSPEYLRFISQICVDTSFLLSFFDDNNFSINNLSLLSARCIDNCQHNREFAIEILKNVDQHFSIILSPSPNEIKELYTSILCAAMDSAPIVESTKLIDLFLAKFRDDFDAILKNYASLPQFFITFQHYYNKVCNENETIDSLVQIWINSFNDFILKSLGNEEVREKGDFSYLFDIYYLMMNGDVNRSDLFLPILSSSSIITFMSSPINSISFTKLLVLLLKHKSVPISNVMLVLEINDNPSVAARCFICALADASDQIKEFIPFCNKKGTQYLSSFLKNVSFLAKQFKDESALSFIALSDLWIENWLLDQSSEIRMSTVKVFDSFSLISNERSIFNCIYIALMNNFERMKNDVILILKSHESLRMKFEEANEKLPTREYFQMLKWSVNNGQLYDEIAKNAKEFGQLCSSFSKYNLMLPILHLLNFVCETVKANSFFDGDILTLFLNGLSNLYYRDSLIVENASMFANFVKLIPDDRCEELFTSKFFQRVLKNFLIGHPGEIISNKIIRNMDKLKKPENFGKALFQAVQTICASTPEILRLSWKAMKKMPELSDLFESEGCRDYLVDVLLQSFFNLPVINRFSSTNPSTGYDLAPKHQNPALCTVRISQGRGMLAYPILKILGVFNQAYTIHNANKSSFLYGNYVTWLSNQWVKQSLRIETIFLIANATVQVSGKSGPFIFLTSLLTFPGNKFVNDIYNLAVYYHIKVSTVKQQIAPGLVYKAPVKTRKSAARFVVSLYDKIVEVQKPVNQITITKFLIDELSASIQDYVMNKNDLYHLNVEPDVIEILAKKVETIINAVTNDVVKQLVADINFIFSTTNDPLILNDGITKLGITLYTKQPKRINIIDWMKNTCRILSSTLVKIIQNNEFSLGVDEEKSVLNVTKFISNIMKRTEIKQPEFSLSSNDLMKVRHILSDNQSTTSTTILKLIERCLD